MTKITIATDELQVTAQLNESPTARAIIEALPLEELARLTETAGGEVTSVLQQRIQSPNPRFYIGEGKAQELKGLLVALHGIVEVLEPAIAACCWVERVIETERAEPLRRVRTQAFIDWLLCEDCLEIEQSVLR